MKHTRASTHEIIAKMIDLTELQLGKALPKQGGAWALVPFSNGFAFDTPFMVVLQGLEKDGGNKLVLGLMEDAPSQEFTADVDALETFVHRAASAMITVWLPRSKAASNPICSLFRTKETVGQPREVRILLDAKRTLLTDDADPDAQNTQNTRSTTSREDFVVGSFVRARINASGIWVSRQKFGVRYELQELQLLRSMGNATGAHEQPTSTQLIERS